MAALSKSHNRVLALLIDGPLFDVELENLRVRVAILQDLERQGLVHHQPYGDPFEHRWRISETGRANLAEL